jgi:release factor glutamine methyltransferase
LGASVHFKHQDVFTAEVDLPFDVLVSNPPYIEREEADSLETKVREHEPALALFVNEHPLEFYRFMVAKFPAWLSPDGIFGFECHSRYADDVVQLCRAAGCQ